MIELCCEFIHVITRFNFDNDIVIKFQFFLKHFLEFLDHCFALFFTYQMSNKNKSKNKKVNKNKNYTIQMERNALRKNKETP